MFESTEMGITELVIFDGTPAAIEYVINAIDHQEIPSLLVCLYGNRRETLMLAVKRLNAHLLETNRFQAHLQRKLLPIYNLAFDWPAQTLTIDTLLTNVIDFMLENPALAAITGTNGKVLPIVYPTVVASTGLQSICVDNKPTKTKWADIHTDGRKFMVKIYPAAAKLKYYDKASPLLKLSAKALRDERACGYAVPRA